MKDMKAIPLFFLKKNLEELNEDSRKFCMDTLKRSYSKPWAELQSQVRRESAEPDYHEAPMYPLIY